MVDDTGAFLAHPVAENILDKGISEYVWGKSMLQKEQGFELYPWQGQDKMVAFKRVAKTGWVVAAGAEMNDIFAPVRRIGNLTLLATLLTLLVVGCVIFVIAQSIVKALQAGVGFAEDITAGDLSKRLKMNSEDEIGLLAGALDRMADGLEEKARLAEQIAAGNLTVDVSLASDRDRLGKALTVMTDSLNEVVSPSSVGRRADCRRLRGRLPIASQSLSQGATESASSLEEISASMIELGSQTRFKCR